MTDRDPTPDETRVMDALRRAVRALSTSARDAAATTPGGAAAGVSGAGRFVLRQIAAAPGLSLGELAARTLARQSTASEVVARLVAAGLVERRPSPDDARRVQLTLTPRGRRAAAAAAPTAQERLTAGLAALPPTRRRALAELLEAWLAAAGLADVPATFFFEPGPPGAGPTDDPATASPAPRRRSRGSPGHRTTS